MKAGSITLAEKSGSSLEIPIGLVSDNVKATRDA
jgi:hypothetical protein